MFFLHTIVRLLSTYRFCALFIYLLLSDYRNLLLQLAYNFNAIVLSFPQNGLTPLHLAAQEDKVPVAEVLVKYEAQIDPHTKAGYTPLHTACHFGQINMIRFLLEQGASVNATTKVRNKDPIKKSIISKPCVLDLVVKRLGDKAEVLNSIAFIFFQLGYTPLHQAAQQGHVLVINLLLKYNANPDAVTTVIMLTMCYALKNYCLYICIFFASNNCFVKFLVYCKLLGFSENLFFI